MLLAACSDGSSAETSQDAGEASLADDEAGVAAETSTGSATVAGQPPGGGFCDNANAFVTDRSVTDVANFNADFFAEVDDRLEALLVEAPAEVAADLEVLRSGFAATDTIFAEFDYDVTDARLVEALEAVDNEGMLAATDSIDSYLLEVCGIRSAANTAEVEDIMTAFSIDRALAECINAELGDVANIASEDLTPELLRQEVCGTSLIALLSGVPPPSS